MNPALIISAGVALIDLITKSIAAANAGDVDEAKAYLAQARAHYENALNRWDAAPGPS